MRDDFPEYIAEARNGEGDAFARLVEAYQGQVYNLCYRMLSDEAEAESAAQEVFWRAYCGIHRYDPSRRFSTWLLSIAAHYCIDLIRRRHLLLISLDAQPEWRELRDNAAGPEDSVIEHERGILIQHLLRRLPARERAVLVLRYWYDLSHEELAREMQMSAGNVKSLLHRGRKRLAKVWQGLEASSVSAYTVPAGTGVS